MPTQSVTVSIAGLAFECVPLGQADFGDEAAVYVILCVSEGGSWQVLDVDARVLDVGQTAQLGSRMASHERKPAWQANCPNKNIWVAVLRMPSALYSDTDRRELEKRLRQQYSPPCGQQ